MSFHFYSSLSTVEACRFGVRLKNACKAEVFECACMLEDSDGKLLVYVSSFLSREERFKSVSGAVEKMARLLKLSCEVITLGKKATPIYIYYKSGDEDPIPIYCDNGERANMQEVCTALRNMMFVLSFHPRHSSLRQMRTAIMRFS